MSEEPLFKVMMSEEPLFKVVEGTPTAEEIAAIVGVLLPRLRAVPATVPAPAPSRWRRSALPGATARSGWW